MKQTTDNTWELNLQTGNVQKAQFKPGSFFGSSGPDGLQTIETWILIQKEKHKYFLALNKKNAERKGFNLLCQYRRSNEAINFLVE